MDKIKKTWKRYVIKDHERGKKPHLKDGENTIIVSISINESLKAMLKKELMNSSFSFMSELARHKLEIPLQIINKIKSEIK